MYSQHDEEVFITMNTPERGRLLDVGAYDARAFSNSRALIERGWEAVLIEPSCGPFSGLIAEYKNNPKITLVNAFVGSEWRMREIQMSPDALTTGDQASFEKWKELGQFFPVVVPEVPLCEILSFKPGPYQFVNVDTEGVSVDILRMIDPTALGVQLFCVEHDNRMDEVQEYFSKHGFNVIHHNAANVIAKKI